MPLVLTRMGFASLFNSLGADLQLALLWGSLGSLSSRQPRQESQLSHLSWSNALRQHDAAICCHIIPLSHCSSLSLSDSMSPFPCHIVSSCFIHFPPSLDPPWTLPGPSLDPPSILCCPNWTIWVSSTNSTSPSSKETNGWTLRRADLLDFGPSQLVYGNGFVRASLNHGCFFQKIHLLPDGPSVKSTACMFGSKLPSIWWPPRVPRMPSIVSIVAYQWFGRIMSILRITMITPVLRQWLRWDTINTSPKRPVVSPNTQEKHGLLLFSGWPQPLQPSDVHSVSACVVCAEKTLKAWE